MEREVVLTRYFHVVGPVSPVTGRPRWVRHDFRTADDERLSTFRLSVAEAALDALGRPAVVDVEGGRLNGLISIQT